MYNYNVRIWINRFFFIFSPEPRGGITKNANQNWVTIRN